MNIKHNPIEVPTDTPFVNCKLKREEYANLLTNIIESYSNGFVLAINNKWGDGKTTFIKMWKQSLENKGFKAIYFNAWENDYEDNPFIALMGELKSIGSKAKNKTFQSVLRNGAVIAKHVLPGIGGHLIKKYLGSEALEDLDSSFITPENSKNIAGALADTGEDTVKALATIFNREIDQYTKRKEKISKFQESLAVYVRENNQDKPLIFFIDELDRCRPNYAVSILEQIKHFFSISNIVFVLSVDKTQLGHAVRGVYGSDRIDAEEYLRRFIDVEYSLPQGSKTEYAEYLYQYYEFDSFFEHKARKYNDELRDEGKAFYSMACSLIAEYDLSLRQLEKIFFQARLSLRSFYLGSKIFARILLVLVYVKLLDSSLYIDIKQKKLTPEELYHKLLPKPKLDEREEARSSRIWVKGLIVAFYYRYASTQLGMSDLLINFPEENTYDIPWLQNIDPKEKEMLIRFLASIVRSAQYRNLAGFDLKYYLDRIDMLEDFADR